MDLLRPVGYRRKIDLRAGSMLVAEVGADVLQRATAALDTAEQHLVASQQAIEELTAVRAELDRVRRFYESRANGDDGRC